MDENSGICSPRSMTRAFVSGAEDTNHSSFITRHRPLGMNFSCSRTLNLVEFADASSSGVGTNNPTPQTLSMAVSTSLT